MTDAHAAVITRRPGPITTERVGSGQLVVPSVPLLSGHAGTPPDLVLRWGSMPGSAVVDVVVHLHGYSARGRAMRLDRDLANVSGLDLHDPSDVGTLGRTSPTLLVLPRGHFYGGRSGRGYSFPALQRPGGLTALVDVALRQFAAQTGAHPTRGRLIITAHSGGGAALMQILRHTDPDEIYTYDALYTNPEPLITWARRHEHAGRGALRVLFRPHEPTAAHSLAVHHSLAGRSPRFRVEQTAVAHGEIPRTFGWRLLADSSADLPGVARPDGRPRPTSGPRLRPTRAPAPPPRPAPPLVPSQRSGHGSALCDAIARVALREYARWRPAGARPLTETSRAASPILREYYRVGIGMAVTDAQLQSAAFQAAHPWSAVFVSFVVRTAGGGRAPFHYSAAHQGYIRAARENRLRGDTSNPFWAFRPTEVAPRVGDLVCASRQNSGATYDNIGNRQTRATHCDVVVEVQPGRIRVIGGNVGQTVGEKWLHTGADGRLLLSGTQSRFFAVITCGPHGAPRPTPPPAPAPRPAGDEDARVLRVMELLVQRYHYPVNGAAGVVGNLLAESAVLPNRIEGSRAGTPMRAEDFTRRVRDFTPEEVRDRDIHRRTGPRLPGVGIAQWTSAARRNGLFQHTFDGRRWDTSILTSLDAQVDYLVSELRQRHAVESVLRSPGVTVDQASDVVLLRFEVPGSVVNRRLTDPAVQQVLRVRRSKGARALRVYRASHPG